MITNYKLFEMIYIGKLNLVDYKYIFDTKSLTGFFIFKDKDGNNYTIEIKGDGEGDENEKFRIFAPGNKDFDLEDLTNKIIYILNKNELGWKFKKEEIVQPKYGLQPYGVLSVNKETTLEEIQGIVASTKPYKKMVKKRGDLDQFTF